jgi:type I restriction enzyme S subunit
MNAERLMQHYERIAEAPDAIARLRQFILDLAVRGKLVPQEPNDEPASDLLKRIEMEKVRLVKAGEIKARSISARDRAEPITFDCPRGWVLTNLGKLSLKITDGAHQTPTYVDQGVPFISVKDFSGGRLDLSSTRYIPQEEHRVLYQRCDPRRGDILIGRIGTLGKAVIVDTDIEFSLFVSVGLIRFDQRSINPTFFRQLLNSPFVAAEFERIKIGGGTHTNKLNLGDLHTVALPLPPLAEQHRIVAKIDELMGLCDRLEAARAEREAKRDRLTAASLARLNTPDPETFEADVRFTLGSLPSLTTRPDQVKALRQTILNLAVYGKLVPQDPSDEPASELLKRVAKEKARLVKAGEISKFAEAKTARQGNLGFDIPSSWHLAIIENVLDELQTGPFGSSLHQSDYRAGGTPVINPASIQAERIVPVEKMAVDAKTMERLATFKLRHGDVVMARRGEMGRCAIVTEREAGWLCGTGSLILRPSKLLSPNFLVLLIGSPLGRQYLGGAAVGTTMQNLNQSILLKLTFGLPPVAEQHRIVSKVDELMKLCDRLEERLTATAATRRRLLDALLVEALAPAEDRDLEVAG